MSDGFYDFNAKITVELEIESDEDGMSIKPKVTVSGITKKQLYWLFEGADIQDDFGEYLYAHMETMKDISTES